MYLNVTGVVKNVKICSFLDRVDLHVQTLGFRQQPAMDSLRGANTMFALDLFRTLSETSASGNIFFSPLSISSALAMVYLGAKGSTADQMVKVGRGGSSALNMSYRAI